ncbi:MAG: ABC transporter permease, partial [Chloroflexi bacterium]|nr:ABC transporter permease [Chloroflexota bacterium]
MPGRLPNVDTPEQKKAGFTLPYFGWWNTYKKSKIGIAGIVIVAIIVIMVIIGPLIAPYNPKQMDASFIFSSPSMKHILGTTSTGQDVFSQLVIFGRVSVLIGIVAASLITFTGAVIGLISGYIGGIVDEILMRCADVLLILPRLPLMIIFAVYMGGSFFSIIFVLWITGWAGIARQIRAQTLSCKKHTFVEASRSIGSNNFRIIRNHIIPNVAGVIIANFVMEIVVAILVESGLSFLGLGDINHPS